jgi:alkylation response protein AidB-like acyl-CoA dehydrogenase
LRRKAVSITFTEEQLSLRKVAQQFFENEVKPVMAELDARPNPKDCYPTDLVRKGSEIGLRTLAIPQEYGGAAADVATKALLLATMSEIEAGTAKIFSQCWKVSQAIAQAGTEEQKKRFLTAFAADDDFTCSIMITEPDAGSDNMLPYTAPEAGIATIAVPDGDSYVLNGAKALSSLAGISKLLLVFARTDRTVPARQGTTTFLVPHDLPGISYGHVYNKMGFRLYPNGDTFFDNVRVPKEFMLGRLNGGFDTFAKIFRGSVEIPSTYLGLCKAIYRIALDYAYQRVQGGKPIIEHQSVGLMLAEIAMQIETLEGYLWDTVFHIQHDANYDVKKTRFGKIFACDCGIKAITLGLDILGGLGIMRDHPMEKLVRDTLTFLHGDGTNSLNKLRVVPLLSQHDSLAEMD